MRTTITLEADVAALVQRFMAEHDVSFKDAVNMALRTSLSATPVESRRELPVFDMGEARMPLEHALRIASELEDEEIVREMGVGR